MTNFQRFGFIKYFTVINVMQTSSPSSYKSHLRTGENTMHEATLYMSSKYIGMQRCRKIEYFTKTKTGADDYHAVDTCFSSTRITIIIIIIAMTELFATSIKLEALSLFLVSSNLLFIYYIWNGVNPVSRGQLINAEWCTVEQTNKYKNMYCETDK